MIFLQLNTCYTGTMIFMEQGERLVTGMLLMQDFVVDGREYLVMESMQGFVPGPAAIRLLTHRREGVGADRVLIKMRDGFLAYSPDGTAGKLSAADYRVLLHAVPSCEMRLTDCFVRRLRAADAAEEQSLAS